MPSKEELAILQKLPLEAKVLKTKQRIREWYYHFGGQVYIALSGGKDSTVLLHIARSVFPDIPAVFSDTGLEYPEIKAFVRTFPNVETVRPKMTFSEVLTKYGYPIVSKEVAEAIYYARRITPEDYECNMTGVGSTGFRKRAELLGQRLKQEQGSKFITVITDKENASPGVDEKPTGLSYFNKQKWLLLAQHAPFRISHYCCKIMKKSPLRKYASKSKRAPILGTMAEESRIRQQAWIRHGCNAFDTTEQTSQPMSFWTEQDVLTYIEDYGLDVAAVYGDLVWTGKDGQITMPFAVGSRLHFTGAQRTGCIFCGFGMHLEKNESRFQLLKRTHPRLYEYAIGGGQWIDNPDYVDGLSMEPDEMGWINWNPERIWVPSVKGLGFGFVFDTGNEIYGKEMWRYK